MTRSQGAMLSEALEKRNAADLGSKQNLHQSLEVQVNPNGADLVTVMLKTLRRQRQRHRLFK